MVPPMTSAADQIPVPDHVRTAFGGRLLDSRHEGYDEVRRLHNGMIDKRPALIAQCQSNADSRMPWEPRSQYAAAVTGSPGAPRPKAA